MDAAPTAPSGRRRRSISSISAACSASRRRTRPPIPTATRFEKGVSKTDGTGGFADVWKRGHFGWEYKKDRANLDRAYQQLQLYSVALENPPLLVVSDTKRFRIYTNWTNTVQEKHDFALEDLAHTEHARASAQRLPQSRQAQARQDPRAGHQGRRQGVLHHRRAPAHGRPRAGQGRAFPQSPGVLPVRRGREPAAGRPVQAPARHAGEAPRPGAGALAEDAGGTVRQHARGRRIRPRTHPAFQRRPVRRRRGAAARREFARHPAQHRAGRTGRRSTRRSSARCSSASSIPTSARRSARTTPTPKRS